MIFDNSHLLGIQQNNLIATLSQQNTNLILYQYVDYRPKIFSDKNILPIKTANIFGKQYFTNKHVLAGQFTTFHKGINFDRIHNI